MKNNTVILASVCILALTLLFVSKEVSVALQSHNAQTINISELSAVSSHTYSAASEQGLIGMDEAASYLRMSTNVFVK